MTEDYETQIDLGDKAADNFGPIYDPSMEESQGRYNPTRPVFLDERREAEGQRRSLAASLLVSAAGEQSTEKWAETATRALAAAAIIYPDPKEEK